MQNLDIEARPVIVQAVVVHSYAPLLPPESMVERGLVHKEGNWGWRLSRRKRMGDECSCISEPDYVHSSCETGRFGLMGDILDILHPSRQVSRRRSSA